MRLAPARLTHCMRWLGQARRAHDVATAYARRRTAFGKVLGEHEGVGFMLADNDMDLHVSRLSILHCAAVLDAGQKATSNRVVRRRSYRKRSNRVVDRSVQMLGGQGVTGETIVMRIYKDIRGFRIYDGPSEVHRWSLARKILSAKTSTADRRA